MRNQDLTILVVVTADPLTSLSSPDSTELKVANFVAMVTATKG